MCYSWFKCLFYLILFYLIWGEIILTWLFLFIYNQVSIPTGLGIWRALSWKLQSCIQATCMGTDYMETGNLCPSSWSFLTPVPKYVICLTLWSESMTISQHTLWSGPWGWKLKFGEIKLGSSTPCENFKKHILPRVLNYITIPCTN